LLCSLVENVPFVGHVRLANPVSVESFDDFVDVRFVVRVVELERAKNSMGSRSDARQEDGSVFLGITVGQISRIS